MALVLDPITLSGRVVQLEPLSVDHVDGLVAASTIERDTYDYTDVPGTHDAMRHYIEKLLADHAAGLRLLLRRQGPGHVKGRLRTRHDAASSGR